MTPASIGRAIDAVAVLGGAIGAVAVGWRALRPIAVDGAPPKRSAILHPWALFLVVSALAIVNQVVVNAYVLAAHGGDPSFIRSIIGPAYFATDYDFPFVRSIAGAFSREGASFWLAPSLLRVNAALELPFAMLAYIAIARLFDRGAARALLRGPLVGIGAVSFTIILCLIEIRLRNPWTDSDLWVRWITCAAVIPAFVWLGRRERGAPSFPDEDGRPRSLVSLFVATTGAASMAAALLALYDVTLLYNLRHLRALGLPIVGLVIVATGAVIAGPRIDALDAKARANGPPPSSVAAMTSVASTLSMLFFVPSLSVRYGLRLPISTAVGAGILIVSVGVGLARAARRPEVRFGRWIVGISIAGTVGALAVFFARPAMRTVGFDEAALLGYALVFLGPFLLTWRALEVIGLDARRPVSAA